MRKFKGIILFTCLLLFVFGCKAMDKPKNESNNPPANNENIPDTKPGGEIVDLSNHPALENRKIIYTVTLGIVSTDPNSTYLDILNNLKTFDAYVESEENTAKLYKVKIRVKSTQLTEVVNAIQNKGETVNYIKTSQDVTNSYSTLQAKLSALEAQHARILELITKAEDLSTILKLEDKRAEIEADLNEIGLSLNNYDSLIDYSTIQLTISKIGNISDLLAPTTEPKVYSDKIQTNSFVIMLYNPFDKPTTMTINITQGGKTIKELTTDIYQQSKESILIDGLKPGVLYKVEVISQANNYAPSSAQMIDVETENTFITSIHNIFIASINALVAFFKFIVFIVVAILPFAITFTIIGIPLRILYVKKFKNKKRP